MPAEEEIVVPQKLWALKEVKVSQEGRYDI